MYRITGSLSSFPLVDIVQLAAAPPPFPGGRVMCRHPFQEKKRAQITPCQVTPLLQLQWDAARGRVEDEEGEGESPARSDGSSSSSSDDTRESSECKVRKIKAFISAQLSAMRPDHLRYLNPTPYKVSVDQKLYDFMHTLWMTEAPVHDLE